MIKILLLSAGTNACYHTAKILKTKFNNFYIIGADINEHFLVPTSRYLDKFYKVNKSADHNYYSTILKICKKEHVNYILPSLDVDLKNFYKENEDLKKIGVVSLGVSKQILRYGFNKKTMTKTLKRLNLPIPNIYGKNSIISSETYFIKPIDGYASIGAKRIKGNNIFKLKNINNFIIQECCYEPEITLECFNYNGELRTIARERIDTKSGVCTKTKIISSPKLTKIAKKLVSSIDCPYCFNIQFMTNKKGQFVITDINLRLAGGMSMSYSAGWDEISALAKIMLHKNKNDILKTLPINVNNQYIVRVYEDLITKVEKPILALDFDGTILDSRKRHIKVLKDAVAKYDIKLEIEDYLKCKKNGMNTYNYLISKNISNSIAYKINSYWIKNIEKKEYLSLDKLYDYSLKMITDYSKKYDLILITARNNKINLMWQLKRTGLFKKFKKVYIVKSDKNTVNYKTNILLEVKPNLMVGDTLSDALASKNSDVPFKHMAEGFHSTKYIKEKLNV